MDKKQLYLNWAPQERYIWTKFAKPALFVHAEDAGGTLVYKANIPQKIQTYNKGKTAIIVDLPGVLSVEIGLGLAGIGFCPVPLYNGIHEANNGGLRNAVDNTAIINALAAGAEILKHTDISANAPPAFLLDANRDEELSESENIYDNRWRLDLDDMPDAAYMQKQGISNIIIWTDREVQGDLESILAGYRNHGIDILIYQHGLLKKEKSNTTDTWSRQKMGNSPAFKEDVRKFENARFCLLLIVILAAFNFTGMFFIRGEPMLWTVPCIMWLTYLWVSEIVGDIIAIIMVITYFALYLMSHKKRSLFLIAAALFALDTAVFYIYAFYYGILAFTGYSLGYGLIVFIPPVIFMNFLIKGTLGYEKIKNISDTEYEICLDDIDGYSNESFTGHPRPRRRIFRPFRGANYSSYNSTGGYRGYGGTGIGGYGGKSSYGGFGG